MNSFLKISEPGQYWLIVKDINNCAGKDSINIKPKDCIKGFYIPTAFTPNGDTWNDKFKPYIFGNIQAYEFYIYNRFGKLIYKSTDVNTGWDGSYLGSAQNSGTYVWFCIYNLIGENKISKKGNVLLIR